MIREEAEAAGRTTLRHTGQGIRFYSDDEIHVLEGPQSLRCVVPARDRETRVFAEVPLGDSASFWRPSSGYELRMPPDWGGRADVSGILRAPFGVLHDHDGLATVGIGVQPAEAAVSLRYGVSEESTTFVVEFLLAAADEERVLLFDANGGDLFQVVARLREATRTSTAHAVTPFAAEPVYSTWYAFHEAMDAASILEEARLARDLGFGALFLDYGWQRFGDSRYFDGCGDWLPDTEKFPDLTATVRELQSMGLGVVLWIAPLLLGERSELFSTLGADATVYNPNLRARVLDPRLPEVRDHVVSTCLRLVQELGVDGLKIDFIDAASDYAAPGDVATHTAIADALVTMLAEVRRGLDDLGYVDLLIEYREPYIGLALASSGDVIRAEDCPGDFIANRRSTLDLRVLGTGQLVHSDMMMWDPALPTATVAALLSNAMFSVPQLSMRLGVMNDEQRAQIGAWLAAWRRTSHLALHGSLTSLRPHLHYPSATAVDGDEALSVVWSADTVLAVPQEVRSATVVNGTRSTRVGVKLARGGTVHTVDHLGAEVLRDVPVAGRCSIEIPVGGRAHLALD
jgi:alpha-galactosidase